MAGVFEDLEWNRLQYYEETALIYAWDLVVAVVMFYGGSTSPCCRRSATKVMTTKSANCGYTTNITDYSIRAVQHINDTNQFVALSSLTLFDSSYLRGYLGFRLCLIGSVL